MRLIPIDIDDNKNDIFRQYADCVEVLNVYPMYYQMVGYSLPWIGYFATIDGKQMVGAGGFKGRPMQNKVEIAYTIFKQHEGKGLGAALCKMLVLLAKKTDPCVVVTARTLMEENASVKLLRRNGFLFKGVVNDKDDGDVWEWEYPDL
jgi:RimJ/RimL family protein N-acetyltransferase